jgi:hypothetical protein
VSPLSTAGPNFSFSGGQIPNALFNTSYGDGNLGALGPVGRQRVILGGLTVPDVVTGVADQVDFGVTDMSGMMGFAFPTLTSYFDKAELDKVGEIQYLTNVTTYNPFVFQAAADGLIDARFGYFFDGLGNDDGTPCGQLTLGGEPNTPIGQFTKAIPVVPSRDPLDPSKAIFDFWKIHLDGFKVLPSNGGQPIVFSYAQDDATKLLDSDSQYRKHVVAIDGAGPLSDIPEEVFDELVKHITPTPSKDQLSNLFIDCNSTLPSLAVTVGGADIFFNRSGILLPQKWAPDQDDCQMGVRPSAEPYDPLFGGTFLSSVVAVHDFTDIKAPTVKFAQRVWE